jgi:hypothetical protein
LQSKPHALANTIALEKAKGYSHTYSIKCSKVSRSPLESSLAAPQWRTVLQWRTRMYKSICFGCLVALYNKGMHYMQNEHNMQMRKALQAKKLWALHALHANYVPLLHHRMYSVFYIRGRIHTHSVVVNVFQYMKIVT